MIMFFSVAFEMLIDQLPYILDKYKIIAKITIRKTKSVKINETKSDITINNKIEFKNE
jgi:hypothetical protein